ncbi:MAG: hypothetical protein SNF86_06640 [Rikenellaceae bacterium]
MARSKNEIFEEMIALKEADAILAEQLTSQSKASFYRALFFVFADAVGNFEEIFDDFKSNVAQLLDTKRTYTSSWWYENALAFQFGYPLAILENGNIGYTETVEDAQVVKRAAVVLNEQGSISLKVAGESNGAAEALGSGEVSAFREYVQDIAPAGLLVSVISADGDKINLQVDIEVDAQVINTEDGSQLADSQSFPVEDAIREFVNDFQATSFGGVLYANKLLSAVLAVSGVTNATLKELSATGFASSAVDVLAADGRKYSTYSGYLVIDELTLSYTDGN